jgi:DNA-binding NtrC family response regulator
MPKETIIVLDQESHILWTLKTLLESEKYAVLVADTIQGALSHLSESEVSALITEYRIDHSPTLEVIREFKKLFPEDYVMILTHSEVGDDEYEKIIKVGTDDFFIKPFPVGRILLHLRKGLEHRQIVLEKKRLADALNDRYFSPKELNNESGNKNVRKEAQ